MHDLIEQATLLLRADRRRDATRPEDPVFQTWTALPVPAEDEDTPLFI